MKISRIYDNLSPLLDPSRVLVIYGPRRVGKTTLLKNFLKTVTIKYRFDTGDDIRIQELLSSQHLGRIKDYVGENQLIVLDEAEYIRNVGMGLKIIIDHIPDVKVIVTGSASLDLANKLGEPLVGRKWTKILYPVSQLELKKHTNTYDLQQKRDQYLIYGSYPEVLTSESTSQKQKILEEITSSYLLKDILALEKIKNSNLLVKLLKLLAFQIGREVSLNELGNQLDIDKKTVKRYLDLLEKTFIIFSLSGYSRNMRKAISKKGKYYFWDNGIRNALIYNFNPLDTRNDIGQLWENFLVIERLKTQSYKPISSNNYFWRTWDKKGIDWVEMRAGKLCGFEFEWKSKASKHKQFWLKAYPDEAVFNLINKENYLDFLA